MMRIILIAALLLSFPAHAGDVKTWNGIADADVKTWNGVVRADIKTWNGVDASAAAGATVIEDFEGSPLVSDLTWTKNLATIGGGTSTVTISSTTSNVTEGTKTWRYQGTVSGGNPMVGAVTTTTVDLSAYTELKIDVFGANIPTDGVVALVISDDPTGMNIYSADSASDLSGAETITIDLEDAGLFLDVSALYIGVVGTAEDAAYDYYSDNLRAQ